jgi:hypothetical protein
MVGGVHYNLTIVLLLECSLTPIKPFKKLPIRDILGCTVYQGLKKFLTQMQHGIAKGAKAQKGFRPPHLSLTPNAL